jgi:hypothetical protein
MTQIFEATTRPSIEILTDQDKAVLRSMFELAPIDRTEPVDLYFGPTARTVVPPAAGSRRSRERVGSSTSASTGRRGPPSTVPGGSRTSSLSDGARGRSHEQNVRTEQHSLLRADHC